MKKSILLFVLVCATFQLMAQNQPAAKSDRIYKADNTVIDCKIIEVTSAEIKYKKANYLDGPTYSISKSDVVTIQYANGDSEVMKNNTTQATAVSNPSRPAEKSLKYSAFGANVYFTDGLHFGGVYDFMWAVGGSNQSYMGFQLGGFYSSFEDFSGGTIYVPFQYKFFPSSANFYVEGTIGPRYTILSYDGLSSYYDSESLFTVSGGLSVGYTVNNSVDISLRYHSYMGIGIGISFTGLTR